MDIKWLKTFIVAAKYENFHKTSEELFLTQPAISKHIKRLEEYLRIPLFDRNGKKISLTSAGHHFLPFAKEMVTKYELGLEDFESWKQGYKRKLILASAPQIASSFLPSILRNFMDQNPDIEVIVNVLRSYEIGEEISAGRADLGLSRIVPIQTNIKSDIVHEEPVIFVGPTEGGAFDEQTILQEYRIITHNHPYYWDDLLNQVKRYYPNVRTMKVTQVEVTKRFIEDGLGVSYLPYTVIKDEIAAKKLVEIKTEKIKPTTSSTFVVTKVETDEIAKFITFLKGALKGF